MTEDERYVQVCKPSFDNLNGKVDEVLRMLKGQDGDAGMCERVRTVERAIIPDLGPRLERVERFQKGIIWPFVAVVGAILAQAVRWLWFRVIGS